MQPAFIHLRLHSEYSIVDGIVRVDEAVAAGSMLIEVREALKLVGGAQWNSPTKPEGLKFDAFLEEIAAEFGNTPRTLYNWIGCAENARKMLGETIDIDSFCVPVSHLLTIPEAELARGTRRRRSRSAGRCT